MSGSLWQRMGNWLPTIPPLIVGIGVSVALHGTALSLHFSFPDASKAMRDFETTYAAYADFQRLMERYWCLRWLQQNDVGEIDATVRREQQVKLDHLPLLLRVPSLPADVGTGRRGRLAVDSIDLLGPEVVCRYLYVMDEVLDESIEEEEAQ